MTWQAIGQRCEARATTLAAACVGARASRGSKPASKPVPCKLGACLFPPTGATPPARRCRSVLSILPACLPACLAVCDSRRRAKGGSSGSFMWSAAQPPAPVNHSQPGRPAHQQYLLVPAYLYQQAGLQLHTRWVIVSLRPPSYAQARAPSSPLVWGMADPAPLAAAALAALPAARALKGGGKAARATPAAAAGAASAADALAQLSVAGAWGDEGRGGERERRGGCGKGQGSGAARRSRRSAWRRALGRRLTERQDSAGNTPHCAALSRSPAPALRPGSSVPPAIARADRVRSKSQRAQKALLTALRALHPQPRLTPLTC